jgi:hypothetical protein
MSTQAVAELQTNTWAGQIKEEQNKFTCLSKFVGAVKDY